MNDVSTHHNGGAKGTRTPDLFVAKVAPGRELGRQDGNGARGRADRRLAGEPTVQRAPRPRQPVVGPRRCAKSQPERERRRAGRTWPRWAAARGVPQLSELAGSTSRLLPYVRVRLVLIDEGASMRRDGRIAPVSITWRTCRPARALPRRGTEWVGSS